MANDKENLANCDLLVVDDEPFSLSIVAGILKDLKCASVIEARDGEKALNVYASEKKPSLSIIDFNMPGMNGLQILKAVRTGRARMPRNHRILMLTGNADLGLVRAAIALDVNSFIVKPASKQILAARLDKALSEHQEMQSIPDYDAVDIDAVSERYLGHKPVGKPRPAEAKDAFEDYIEFRVPLEHVTPGSILGRSIQSRSGDVLIGRGTVLTERFIRRLGELQDVIGLQAVEILIPRVKGGAW